MDGDAPAKPRPKNRGHVTIETPPHSSRGSGHATPVVPRSPLLHKRGLRHLVRRLKGRGQTRPLRSNSIARMKSFVASSPEKLLNSISLAPERKLVLGCFPKRVRNGRRDGRVGGGNQHGGVNVRRQKTLLGAYPILNRNASMIASSRRTYYTCCSSASSVGSRRHVSPGRGSQISKFCDVELGSTSVSSGLSSPSIVGNEAAAPSVPCTGVCAHPAHTTFDPLFPLVLPRMEREESVSGEEELLIHAKAICGRWQTMLDRSESLDAQMAFVGIGKMKRMVMNKLQIQFCAILKEEEGLLESYIVTPAGNKNSTASLKGKETIDADSDLGDWTAETRMVNFAHPKFCDGRATFRAMQMKRYNKKLNTIAFETRAVLPDKSEDRVLLYAITLVPQAINRDPLHVARMYRFMSSTI